jgi:transketolase
MAALMQLRHVFVLTHDSIGLGEDGPTHQPVEHAASLRLIPHLDVWRPCDTVETAVAGRAVVRCAVPRRCCCRARTLRSRGTRRSPDRRGGYVLADFAPGRSNAVLATGPRSLALAAREALAKDGIAVRVVSMPCTQAFDRQDAAWRASVLPPCVTRVAVEAGATDGWRKYVGAADDPRAAVIGVDSFGESAPAGVLFKHFGITAEAVADALRRVTA